MKKLWLIFGALICVAGATVGTAQADEHTRVDHQGLYVGAGYGWLKTKGDDEFEEDNDAAKFFVGAQLNQVLSVEGSYINFGEFGGDVASADVDGFTLALKAGLPIGDLFTLYAFGGQLWWDADLEVLGVDGDTDGDELFYGAGGSLALSNDVDLRLEYTRFNVEFEEDEIGAAANIDDTDTDLDFVSASLQYTF